MIKRTYYDLSTLVVSLLVENINFLRAQRKVQGNLAKACFYLKRALEDSLDLWRGPLLGLNVIFWESISINTFKRAGIKSNSNSWSQEPTCLFLLLVLFLQNRMHTRKNINWRKQAQKPLIFTQKVMGHNVCKYKSPKNLI